jgi:hypothetical protein
MVVGEQTPLVFQELKKMGHLFQVGGDIGVVTLEVDVIKLNVDDVLDGTSSRLQSALAAGTCWLFGRGGTRLGLGCTGKEA